MRNALLPLAALLTGCTDLTGIWLFQIPYQESTAGCDTSVAENFSEGYVPAEGEATVGEWLYTEDYEGTDAIAFGQIETYGKDQAILVLGTAVYPGTKDGKSWIFEWVNDETSQTKEEHYQGAAVDYGYLAEETSVSTTTYTFDMEGKKQATVKIESTGTSTVHWFESDEWPDEVAAEIGSSGQIPSYSYLVYDDAGDSYSQYNDYDVDDCQGNVCEILVETTCSDDGEFIAYKTDYNEEDYYEHMQGAGQ